MRKQAKVDDALMRRISTALDEGGLDADPELRARLDDDPDALRYAQDLVRIDEVLASLGEGAAEPDWDALAARIDAGLDAELPPLDVEEAPRFSDDASGPVALGSPPREERAHVAKPAPVVDLESRRARRTPVLAWMSGLAAAAAVGLGITFGLTNFDAAPESAMAPATSGELGSLREVAEEEPAEATAGAGSAELAPARVAAPAAESAAPGRFAEPEPRYAAQAALEDGLARRGRVARPRRAAPVVEESAPRAEARGGLADLSDGAEVLAALRAVEPEVQRCLARLGEVAQVEIEVGAGGEVSSVQVRPPYAGEDARCIAAAVREARLPPSAAGAIYPYAYRPAPVAGGSMVRGQAARRRRRARPAPSASPPAQDQPAESDALSGLEGL